MEQKLNGIALILFAILFYLVSHIIQEYMWEWDIGVTVPWGIIALLIGIVGMVITFYKKQSKQWKYIPKRIKF